MTTKFYLKFEMQIYNLNNNDILNLYFMNDFININYKRKKKPKI